MTFVHPTFGVLHLGRHSPSPRNARTMAKAFHFHDYLADLPDPPSSWDSTGGITTAWGMMLNDVEGDCTCAACGHLIQSWTISSGGPTGEVTVPDSAIQLAYEKACGYDPADPASDQGGVISNVLDYFRDVGIGGHRISAHAEVNLTQLRISQAISLVGAIDIGIELPVSAQSQVGGLWDFVADSPDMAGGWGGHSVAVVQYDPSGLSCVTWGRLQKMTWRWFEYYCDEAHAAISPDYKRLSGMNNLSDELNALGS